MTFEQFARTFEVVTSIGPDRPELKGNYFLLEQKGEEWEVTASAVEFYILRILPQRRFTSREDAFDFIEPLGRMRDVYRVYMHLEEKPNKLSALYA